MSGYFWVSAQFVDTFSVYANRTANRMKNFKVQIILYLILSVTTNGLSNNHLDNLPFKQFSTFNGLPNNMVHQVYQDRDGYIWIATFYGLFRYDGYEVRTIKSNLYSPGLLNNNNVICVKEDYSHQLWIGTHEGLNILDKQTGNIRKVKLEGINRQRLNDIYVADNDRVYLGFIRGLAYYESRQDSIILMTQQNSKGDVPEQTNIQALIEDDNGDLLIGTWNHGLYRYIVEDNRFIHYSSEKLNQILSLFKDSQGKIWIGGSGSGLHLINFSSDKKDITIETFQHNASNEKSLCSDYVYSIDEDMQTQSLWLGTRNGLSIMYLDDLGSFVNYRDSDSENYLLIHEVNSVLRDKSGLMWIGTKGAGVFNVDTQARSFGIFHTQNSKALFTDYISALYVEENGAVWVGFGYGVDYYRDGKSRNVVSTPRPYSISYSASTQEILLTAHDEGVIICHNGKVIKQYTTNNSDFVPHNLVYTVCEDKKGNWWLGTYMGLGVRYKDGRSYRFNLLEHSDELLHKEITCIAEDKDGSLWLATNNNGIVHVTGEMEYPNTFYCKNYCIENGLLPVNTPLCFFQDKAGHFWAGTEGSGLCLYDPVADRFVTVHQQYNLPGDMVGSIEEDDQGNLWIGTNQGLAKLTLKENDKAKVRIFTVADGLADNFFNKNASCYREGKLYFGCSRGIVSFNANMAENNNHEISLRITDILLNGKSLELLDEDQRKGISLFTADFTNNLVIPSAYNNFSIRFASLTYNMPQQNNYAYRLLNFDTEWHYVNADNRTAYYTNLSPGKYIFELRATNENGDWSNIRKMEIIVEPPFWATWWAYLLYFAIVIIVVGLILWEIRRRVILRNQLHLHEVETYKIRELNHLKLQFFTNITHELMTPLTIISATLDELKMQIPTFKELYKTMDINVQRLIRLLQQILEFRKAESGNLQLRVAKGNIALFVQHEAESFEPLIRHHQLHFSVLCEQELMEAYFDRDKLDKILYNLLSNAAKYNRKDGFIQLSVKYSDDKTSVVISVKDNGKGISKDQQKNLFERFYEGEYRQSHTIGTGIGLSLIKDLVILHRGTILVESDLDKGTQFFVEIPIERNAYSDQEIIEIIDDRDTIENEVYDNEANNPTLQPNSNLSSVLLVEDNEELLSAMTRLLSREYRILKASNGRDALNIIDNEDIDLVVSDIVMPHMNGLELTKAIKQNPEICHIPVVLLTAKSGEQDREEGYMVGADAYLTKPFSLSTLYARIKNLLVAKERTANDFKRQFAFEIKTLNYTDLDEDFLQSAIACVNNHLDNIEFDITQFTSEMAISRTTLHKKLKSLTGLSATAFIRNIRLKSSCKIMDANKGIRISDLAYMVGFNDPKYFSICFRKEFGLQPTEYLEKYTNSLY